MGSVILFCRHLTIVDRTVDLDLHISLTAGAISPRALRVYFSDISTTRVIRLVNTYGWRTTRGTSVTGHSDVNSLPPVSTLPNLLISTSETIQLPHLR